MIVLAEVDDNELPIPDNMLASLEDSKDLII